MEETSPDDAYPEDPDEAAFQRLAHGLAALRRDTDRLREPADSLARPPAESRAVTEALAEAHRRIDALAARINTPGDSAAVLAMLAAVEEKIGSLAGDLNRFAERGALNEAVEKVNGRIDSFAARIDARLNRLQDVQAELNARQKAPAPTSMPWYRRRAVPVVLLVLLLLGALGMLGVARPDLVRPDWLRRHLADPVHDRISGWLRLGAAPRESDASHMAALVPAPAPVSEPAPASIEVADPRSDGGEVLAAIVSEAPEPTIPGIAPKEAEITAAIPAAPAEAGPDPGSEPAVSELAVAKPAPVPVPAVPVLAAPILAAPARPSIVLSARGEVWLQVLDGGGRALLSRILHEGETWKVPDLPDLRMSTGNAGATVVLVDGVALPPLGTSGAVRRDISIDAFAVSTGNRRQANAAPAPLNRAGVANSSETTSR